MYKIVFVVLHYETLNDTEECLNSLKKYISKNVHIVVVDNGSTNGRIEQIQNQYENSNIHFLYSDTNLGFARGNNIGFKYAKEELNADIIILANNDLVFKQYDFIEKLINRYKLEKFDVAGPRIISLVDGMNQNPVHKIYNSIKDVKSRIIKFKILYFLSFFNLDIKFKNIYSQKINEVILKKDEDFQLHGACMIFANKYLKEYNGLCDKTFMYGEESILKCIVEKNNMKMKYFDDIEVFHKEGSSTQKIWGKGKKSRQFFYKWNIKSCYILEKIMKNSKSI